MSVIDAPSPNADARPGPVRHLMLHYTGMQSAAAAVARLRDPAARVSSHYVVDEDGTVYALVEESRRAWHAGISAWRGVRQLNDSAIGIEIVNPGHEWGYRAFPQTQMQAVLALCQDILARHEIPARNVIGHSDAAPDRKQDPGELFDWRWLAQQGVGLWSDDFSPPGDLIADLGVIGYDAGLDTATVISAFQRHFCPDELAGGPGQKTAGRAAALRRLVDGQP